MKAGGYEGSPWCATSVKSDKTFNAWGYCKSPKCKSCLTANEFNTGDVSCGVHKATSCRKCPCKSDGTYNGNSWCNGDCFWNRNNKCAGKNETSSCDLDEEESKCNFPFLFEGKLYDTCLTTTRGTGFCPPREQYKGKNQTTEPKMWRRCSASCYSSEPTKPICRSLRTGRPCLLPFTYKNTTYKGCLKDSESDGKAWCPTVMDNDNNPLRWADCSADCPRVDPEAPVCMTEDGAGPCLFPYRYKDTGLVMKRYSIWCIFIIYLDLFCFSLHTLHKEE